MTRLIWDQTKDYSIGLERGVFYPSVGPGECWNGLISVIETEDTEVSESYFDGIKVENHRRIGYLSGTIEAFTYPDSFYEEALFYRRPKYFGLSYRVNSENSYKIHLIYNLSITPSSVANEQETAGSFSWDFTTKPLSIPGGLRSAHFVIDSSLAYSWTMEALEDILYGTVSLAPNLPSQETLLTIFEENSILRVIDNGDGSFTATGPDGVIQMLDTTTFQIDWPSAVYIDSESYTMHSL